MKVVTAAEMRAIDRAAIDIHGIPSQVLMAHAGKAVADLILSCEKPSRVAVVCGAGNNGGDGFVAAYHLANAGLLTDVYLAGPRDKVQPVPSVFLEICEKSSIPVTCLDGTVPVPDFSCYDLLVDALLGTGFSGAPRGIIRDCIQALNDSGKRIVALDMPSGLSSEGEGPAGIAVLAGRTITIGLPKISLVTWPGKKYTGDLDVVEIGFPRGLVNSSELTTELVDDLFVRSHFIHEHNPDAHKGTNGHLLVIGGFDGMEGAAMMTALAAFTTGAGLVTLGTTTEARKIIAGAIPELITADITAQEPADFFRERRCRALVMGPGMGRTARAREIFTQVLDALPLSGIGKVLVDGDGLFHLAALLHDDPQAVKLCHEIEFILTPHILEASRFLGRDVEDIAGNRYEAAKEVSRAACAVCLLKGPLSVTTNGITTFINTTGTPALATAGTGDVLSGIIGSLLLRELSPLNAAAAGAWIHGRAAEIIRTQRGTLILRATDLIGSLQQVIASIC